MKPRCAVCRRPTEPYVMVGSEAIGPTCARKMGLTRRTKGVSVPSKRARAPVDDKQLRLFDL